MEDEIAALVCVSLPQLTQLTTMDSRRLLTTVLGCARQAVSDIKPLGN